MDLATLRKLKPAAFEDAADGYRATGEMAARAKDAIDIRISSGIRAQLEGETANAALGELKELSENFHYVQTECALVSTALAGFAHDMAAARRKLDAAVADARAAGCTVNADGSVSFPAGGQAVDGKIPEGGTVTGTGGPSSPAADALYRQAANAHPNPHYGKALEFANRIADAVREATDADTKWAPKLRALKADDDLTVSDHDWTDTQSDTSGIRHAAAAYLGTIEAPPKDGTPEKNAQWWKDLSPEQRADYLAVHPGALGAMNGLPADVRDEANRTVLAETRAMYRLELAAIPKEPAMYGQGPGGYRVDVITPEWQEWHRKYAGKKAEMEGVLKGMDAIQARFDRTGRDGLPEAYLLGFDPTGLADGKVILANGNPDTADHVGIYVPGTFSHIASIGGDDDTHGDLGRGDRLWTESTRLAPGQKVSTIMWFDYNAPDHIPQATRHQYADEGGPRLYDFLQGSKAAQESVDGTRAHTTVIGHSYGSTVVGVAAQSGTWRDPAAVNDLVFAGSPGVQADHAADLGVGADRVWAMGAPLDDFVVRHGGRLVGLGDNWTIPTDEAFGGNVMESDAGGHTKFWDAGSTSLWNQAAVMVGQRDKVEIE